MPSEPKSPAAQAASEAASLEERKFQLELRRFELERSKSRGLFGFVNNNLGVIITAIIGFATVVVSYLQLSISSQSSDAQLKLQRATSEAEKEKDARAFQYDIARLLLERQSDINTTDVRQVYYLRDIVMASLPEDIGLKITRKMADDASDDQVRSAWLDGFVKLRISETAPAAAVSQPSITVDYVVGQFPVLATADGTKRIADLLGAAQEYRLEDSEAVLLAFVLLQTNYFRSLEENLNYSAERLMRVWPNRFRDASQAKPFESVPEKLANWVYANRIGNGDESSGDGWRYRGRGYLLTSGRANYARSSTLVGIDLVADPDKLLDSKVAAKEAAATFAGFGRPITVQSAVRQINGGFLGLAQVQAIYEKLAPGTPQVTQGLTFPSAAAQLPVVRP
jgi:putative chitinase